MPRLPTARDSLSSTFDQISILQLPCLIGWAGITENSRLEAREKHKLVPLFNRLVPRTDSQNSPLRHTIEYASDILPRAGLIKENVKLVVHHLDNFARQPDPGWVGAVRRRFNQTAIVLPPRVDMVKRRRCPHCCRGAWPRNEACCRCMSERLLLLLLPLLWCLVMGNKRKLFRMFPRTLASHAHSLQALMSEHKIARRARHVYVVIGRCWQVIVEALP